MMMVFSGGNVVKDNSFPVSFEKIPVADVHSSLMVGGEGGEGVGLLHINSDLYWDAISLRNI